MNITEPIRANAARHPDRPAYLRTRHASYTFREYDAVIDAVAQRALDAGIAAGQRVAITVEREFAHLTVMLALARIGVASFLPGSGDDPCDACIASRNAGPVMRARTIPIVHGWFDVPAEPRPVAMHAGGDAPVALFATSSAAGRPERVSLSHRDLAARIDRAERAAALPDPLRMLSTVRASASYGLQVALATLGRGGAVVEPADAQTSAQIARHAVTWLVISAGDLASMIADLRPGEGPFPSLERVEVSGSTAAARQLRVAAERVSPNLAVLCGSTETGVIARARVDEPDALDGSAGRLEPDVDVEAVDDDGRPSAPGEAGVLRVRGPGTVRGYVDDDDATQRVFRDGWFHSSDVGYATEDRRLVLRSRADARIAHEGVEQVVLGVPGVTDAAAFDVASATGEDRIGIAIVTGPGFDFERLKAACSERLGSSAPSIALNVARIPRDGNGEVQREALARVAAGHATADAARPH